MGQKRLRWDPTLYAGSAAFYARGRVAYPRPHLRVAHRAALGRDGAGFFDVGCGPGSLTLLLAPEFAEAVGIDADAAMIREASRLARLANVHTVDWLCLRAEELPAALGSFRAVSFAQSFHWLQGAKVAAIVRGMLEDGGACIYVRATTHEGIDRADDLPNPPAPRTAIKHLVQRYLGPDRRAGQGVVADDLPDGYEVFRNAGFTGPTTVEVPGRIVTRTVDDVVAATFSLSSATPHLFGTAVDDFEADLRALLAE